jgi:hypothetical protein
VFELDLGTIADARVAPARHVEHSTNTTMALANSACCLAPAIEHSGPPGAAKNCLSIFVHAALFSAQGSKASAPARGFTIDAVTGHTCAQAMIN